jgi:signal transduction histidine kinase
MKDLSLHILDIAENAIRAKAKKIGIEILEDEAADRLFVIVEDDGLGMDAQTLKKARDPFFTTKDRKKFGLGLALLHQAAEQAGGALVIDSQEGKGTKVTAVFKRSHPDTKPLGNILKTVAALVATNAGVRFIYEYKKGDDRVHYDSDD